VENKNRKVIKLAPGEEQVIPVAEEEVKVGKLTRPAGVTRISKTVHEKVEVIDEPLIEDEVTIERMPVNKYVDGPLPVREENGTTIVPVLEEVLVTEKRILLKEELHIRKVSRTVHKPQKIVLRSEEALVEHLPGEEQLKRRKP
jgi:stress response protein YsnF